MSIPDPAPPAAGYAFGPFVVDSVRRTVWTEQAAIALPGKAFELLLVLIANRHRITTKEELLAEIWPGTFVQENNLAKHVSTLRKALGEQPDEPDCIMTVQGRGYRFVAPVVELDSDALALRARPHRVVPAEPGTDTLASVVPPEPTLRAPRRRVGLVLAAGLALIAAVAVVGVSYINASRSEPASRPWMLHQITYGPSAQLTPAWSPDGRSLVYSSDRNGNFDLFVQKTDGSEPRQLTFSPSQEADPAWSPDGNWIAFRSDQDGGGIFVTAASDGRQVRRVSPIGFGPQWSPDGTRILFRSSHLDRPRPTVLVVSRDGGQPTAVRPDIVSEMRLTGFGWHPDGKRVSFAGFAAGTGSTFVTADLEGNSAVTSTFDSPVESLIREHGLTVGRFVWNRRGTRIFFEGQSHEATSIWAVHVNPSTLRWEGHLERLTAGAGLDRNLSLTADGRRLAFESASARTRIWAYRISPSTGVVTDSGKPITPGGPGEFDVAVSPDGDRLVFRTERDGRQELWQQSLVDGRLQRLLADSLHVRTFPRWSPDGANLTYAISPRRSASSIRSDVSLAVMPTASDGQERIIQIAATGEIYPDDWSADGRQILGVCRVDQSDRTSVCVVPVSGNGPYTVLASDPERTLRNARFSPDQRWFTFTRHGSAGVSTVCVRRTSGGPIIELTDGTAFEDKAHWSPDGSRIYFVSNRGGVLNVWGRFFDQTTGTPMGAVFQATHFNDPRHGLPSNLGPVDLSLTRDQLFVPITETTGQVWVLEDMEP